MKKKSFLSGINAKLAFAVVALAGTMFASCEKEELTVTPVDPSDPDININNPVTIEAGDATATIAIIVKDADTQTTIVDAEITDENGAKVENYIPVKCEADGSITAGKRIYTAKKDGYIAGQGIAIIPQLSKGQTALVSVDIILTRIESAGTGFNVSTDEEQTVQNTEPQAPTSEVNEGDTPKDLAVSYTVYRGQEVENLDEIDAYIDQLVPLTRMTPSEVRQVLKAKVRTLNTGITEETRTRVVEQVPAYYAASITVTVTYEVTIQTITLTVDGKTYEIPGIRVRRVVSNVVGNPVLTPMSHDMGHGHGDTPTSGGGAGDAE